MRVSDEEFNPELEGGKIRAGLHATFPQERFNLWQLFLAVFAGYLLWDYKNTAVALGVASDTFVWVLLAVLVITVVNRIVIWWGFGQYINCVLFSIVTGRTYVLNHMAYRRAAGYDIPLVLNVLATLGSYALFSYTVTLPTDPLANVRTVLGYLGMLCGFQVVAVLIVGTVAFRIFAKRYGHGKWWKE